MTVNAQSGVGRIRLFEDFYGGHEVLDASTAATMPAGPFKFIGVGIAETDTQIATDEGTAPLSGVIILETDDADKTTTAIATSKGFDAGLMGTLVLETRVQFDNLDTKVCFIGFCDENADSLSIEDNIIDVTTTATIENTASDMVGFFWQDEITLHEEWHACYRGGSAASSTDTDDNNLGVDAVAGEWQIIRIEVDNNGTARWYIDGVLLKTLEGALSTTTDVAAVVGVGGHGGVELMFVDYVLVEANRDWNA